MNRSKRGHASGSNSILGCAFFFAGLPMKNLSWSWFDHRADLPRWLTSGIGQIAVEWSILERELGELIRLLMDVDVGKARIVTTGMNARTRLAVAKNYVQERVYHKSLDVKFFNDLADFSNKITNTLEPDRNMVVHGLWDSRKGRWYVLRQSGARPTPTLQPTIKKLFRPVLPQREPMTAEKLNEMARDIAAATAEIVAFCARLEGALAPLIHKPPQYTRRRHRSRAYNKPSP
jgi:hypothetical protein